MKKLSLILLAMFLGMMAIPAFTQPKETLTKKAAKETKKEIRAERITLRRLNGSNVNVKAKENFVTEFGNIPEVRWNRSNYMDEARFTRNGKPVTAYYDFKGVLVGTTEPQDFCRSSFQGTDRNPFKIQGLYGWPGYLL